MRFRKSIKIFPGVKLNLTRHGISSVSIGRRGATLNVGGKQGAKFTVGLPGTGLSHTMRVGSRPPRARSSRAQQFIGPTDGAVVNEAEYKRQCYLESLNQQRLIAGPAFDPEEPYRKFMPEKPPLAIWAILLAAVSLFFLVKLSGPAGGGLSGLQTAFLLALVVSAVVILTDIFRRRSWRRAAGRVTERMRSAHLGHGAAVEAVLTRDLEEIYGPVGAAASVHASPDGRAVSVELDIPTVDALAAVVPPSRYSKAGVRADWKKANLVRDDYRLLACSTLMRVAGEAFRLFPTVVRATMSACALVTDASTGMTGRGCLLSVVFDRPTWETMDPSSAVPADCVGRFANRTDVAQDGSMRPVQPFPPA